jgi:DNA-binding Lrp family transcriptional regulator
MPAKAYVLIETTVGRSREISNRLYKIDGVETVDQVTGPYDLIVVLKRPDLNSVGNLVTNQIHVIEGIARTVTCLSMNVQE